MVATRRQTGPPPAGALKEQVMKPAEVVTVVVSIPMIAALITAEVAASRAPEPMPVETAHAAALSANFFDEIVVVARRASTKS